MLIRKVKTNLFCFDFCFNKAIVLTGISGGVGCSAGMQAPIGILLVSSSQAGSTASGSATVGRTARGHSGAGSWVGTT